VFEMLLSYSLYFVLIWPGSLINSIVFNLFDARKLLRIGLIVLSN
jgi:hypothetical protein